MGLLEIKQALQRDSKFRSLFPEYADGIQKFLSDPSCACNAPLYRQIAAHQDRLEKYSGNSPTPPLTPAISQPRYKVVSCPLDKLEAELNKVGKTHAPITATRSGGEITVILREV